MKLISVLFCLTVYTVPFTFTTAPNVSLLNACGSYCLAKLLCRRSCLKRRRSCQFSQFRNNHMGRRGLFFFYKNSCYTSYRDTRHTSVPTFLYSIQILGYRLDDRGIRVRFLQGQDIFLLSIASTQTVGPTKTLIQWVLQWGGAILRE